MLEEEESHEEDPVDVVAVAAVVVDTMPLEDRWRRAVEVEADVELAMEEGHEDDDGEKEGLASLNRMAVVVAAAAMKEHDTGPYNFRPASQHFEEQPVGVVAMAEATCTDHCAHHTAVDIDY